MVETGHGRILEDAACSGEVEEISPFVKLNYKQVTSAIEK